MPLPAALAARLAKRGIITNSDKPGKYNLKIYIFVCYFHCLCIILNVFLIKFLQFLLKWKWFNFQNCLALIFILYFWI